MRSLPPYAVIHLAAETERTRPGEEREVAPAPAQASDSGSRAAPTPRQARLPAYLVPFVVAA